MTSRDFVAFASALAEHLTDGQRDLVARFAATIANRNGELALTRRSRREAERQFEEQQLSGPELARRQREPA